MEVYYTPIYSLILKITGIITLVPEDVAHEWDMSLQIPGKHNIYIYISPNI